MISLWGMIRIDLVFTFLLGLGGVGLVQGAGAPTEEAGGKWNAPPVEVPAWVSQPTELRFPVQFGNYVMQGVFDYEGAKDDHIIRYESVTERARGDVFLIKKEAVGKTVEALEELLHESLIAILDDFFTMAEQGRYEELAEEGALEGKIELWKAEAIPLKAQKLAATRVEKVGDKEVRTPLKIWYGATVYKGYAVIMRHMRPADEGAKGEEGMKAFVDGVMRVIKDPSLRKEVLPAFQVYMKEPLSESGQEAAKLVLGYLDKSPMVPVLLPQPPLTVWAEEMEKLVPNAGAQFLRAYVITGAMAAMEGKDSNSCLTLACQQVVRVYLEMQRLQPTIRYEGLEALTRAVERGEAAKWLQQQMAEKKP
jgi:hypothetical protein